MIVQEIQQIMGDRLGFVFRNFPLAQIHPNARDAAQAAGAQGAFWKMHDILFENQDDLSRDAVARYAESLGLDTIRLSDEIAAGAHAKRVQEDFRSGVNGTPTFFINGVRYDGRRDVDSMVSALVAPKE